MSTRVQLRSDAVALLSLTVALANLGDTKWRSERSKHERAGRQPSFQLRIALGELQQVVFCCPLRR